MEISDKKFRDYLNMTNFINNILPMLVSSEELELCRKYFKDGRLTNADLKKLVGDRL